MDQPWFSQKILWRYFFITYLVLLVNASGYLKDISGSSTITLLFTVAVYLTYCLMYLLPPMLLLLLCSIILTRRMVTRFFETLGLQGSWVICGAAITGFTAVQILIHTDEQIYRIFGFHFNGFVWNLVSTRGGLESLGGGQSSFISFALVIVSFLVIQGLLLMLVVAAKRIRSAWSPRITQFVRTALVVALLILTFFQVITYDLSSFCGYTPVLAASRAFPFYIPVTTHKLIESLGFEDQRQPAFSINVDAPLKLRYPLKTIKRDKNHQAYNIVWLVAESLRADMIDPEIMPATYGFARKAAWFQNHYSGGNGTRMGMFTMFYGLYGAYWFSFLDERRGPLLIDLMLEDQYKFDMFTSAKFTYPEFDKTIFASIPQSQLHECNGGPGWERDRRNVSRLLDFLNHHDQSRPFMTFMFFESSHARYYFPAETVIRRPYLEDFNYATMDLAKDITLIKNRYINSCNHLDSQLSRIIRYLKEHHMLDSTIVLITGDHGEEFMEQGHWGHGSAFTEEQIRVPLILWVPGRPSQQITAMTSHLDIAATLLPLLGVHNLPEDYSQGFDLLAKGRREYSIVSDWSSLVYIDQEFKAIFPLKVYGLTYQKITTNNDLDVIDTALFYESRRKQITQVMQGLAKFR